MGIIDKIKHDVQKSGSSRNKIFYVKDGQKARIRFLQDMEEGHELVFHDSYDKGINVLCKEHIGKACQYCDDDSLRTRSLYCWSVYNYEAKEVQLFLYAVNNCSPLSALMALYETYGTLLDRDFVISVTGKQQNKTFSVVPMDKNKFRNEKAKPYGEQKMLDIIVKAYPYEDDDQDENDEEDERPAKKTGKKNTKAPRDEDDEWEEEEDQEQSYDDMSPKELYKLCKERKIDVEAKKPQKYYIKKLEAWDEAQDDWGDDDNEDDDQWED